MVSLSREREVPNWTAALAKLRRSATVTKAFISAISGPRIGRISRMTRTNNTALSKEPPAAIFTIEGAEGFLAAMMKEYRQWPIFSSFRPACPATLRNPA
jgi:hypothetical protein